VRVSKSVKKSYRSIKRIINFFLFPSLQFCADRLASGREGGKKFIDDLARIVENRYAETRKEDDPKEIWLTFEIFLSEAMGREGNMREFLIGISDAINVKLVRVYGENTTSLAWKLAGKCSRNSNSETET
jgi:hypothetical protein